MILKRWNRTAKYWEGVQYEIAGQAYRWSCGTEGRLLLENLVLHEEARERCEKLAPKSRTFGPKDLAAAIVIRYFSQSI